MNDLKRVVVKPFGVDKFEVVKEFVFYSNAYGKSILISAGYKTNGANVPRLFWSIYPPYRSEYFSAVIIHDFLCDKAKSKKDYELADKTLKEAMQVLGVGKITTNIFFYSCFYFHKIKCFFKGIK